LPKTESVTTFSGVDRNCREAYKVASYITDIAKNIKPLIGQPGPTPPGSRLTILGIAVMAIPEPTLVTDAAGAALIAVGLFQAKLKPVTRPDVSGEVQCIMRKLKDLTWDVTL